MHCCCASSTGIQDWIWTGSWTDMPPNIPEGCILLIRSRWSMISPRSNQDLDSISESKIKRTVIAENHSTAGHSAAYCIVGCVVCILGYYCRIRLVFFGTLMIEQVSMKFPSVYIEITVKAAILL